MIDEAEARALIACMASAATRTPEVVDPYYTLCIPFYREFLGNHLHTGYYLPQGPIGPADQLRMELRIAQSAGLKRDCEVLGRGLRNRRGAAQRRLSNPRLHMDAQPAALRFLAGFAPAKRHVGRPQPLRVCQRA